MSIGSSALLLLSLWTAVASADVTLTVTTTPSGGNYAPENVVAAWLEDGNGNFIRTLNRAANVRKMHLVAWNQKAGPNDIDAISGGTRTSHSTMTIKWNLRDRAGVVLPDGNYVIRMELADENAGAAGQNNQGTFPFVKSPTATMMTGLSSGGFINGTLTFNNTTGACENGIVEAGETCDNNCVTSCTPSTIMCFSNNLVGSPQLCNAQCANQPVMECIDDDGCCPDPCDGTTDSDCPGGGGGGEGEDLSNCSASDHPAGWLFAGLVLGVILLRRRR